MERMREKVNHDRLQERERGWVREITRERDRKEKEGVKEITRNRERERERERERDY